VRFFVRRFIDDAKLFSDLEVETKRLNDSLVEDAAGGQGAREPTMSAVVR
jgi:hypothetical protein